MRPIVKLVGTVGEFADLTSTSLVSCCSGERGLLSIAPAAGDRSEGLSVPSPTSSGEDSCGRLCVVSNNGAVYRLKGTTPPDCPVPNPALPGQPAPAAAPPQTRRRFRVRLGAAARRVGGGVKLVLAVHVSPCVGQAGSRVQLNRGGRQIATKRLDQACVARFRLQISHRSTFRALLPAMGYRSQVRTIALAKPRP